MLIDFIDLAPHHLDHKFSLPKQVRARCGSWRWRQQSTLPPLIRQAKVRRTKISILTGYVYSDWHPNTLTDNTSKMICWFLIAIPREPRCGCAATAYEPSLTVLGVAFSGSTGVRRRYVPCNPPLHAVPAQFYHRPASQAALPLCNRSHSIDQSRQRGSWTQRRATLMLSPSFQLPLSWSTIELCIFPPKMHFVHEIKFFEQMI